MNYYHKVSDVLTNCIKHDLLVAPCNWRGTRSPQYLTLEVASLYIKNSHVYATLTPDFRCSMDYWKLRIKECYVFSETCA